MHLVGFNYQNAFIWYFMSCCVWREKGGKNISGWIEFRGFVCSGGAVCQHSAVIPSPAIVSWCNASYRRRLFVDTLHVILSAVGYCYSLQLERHAVTFTALNSPLFVAKLPYVNIFTNECKFCWTVCL